MRRLPWGQCLTVAVAFSLTLLMVGMIGLEVAIRQGVVEPPNVAWQLGGVRITAYRTSTPECPPDFCTEKSVAPPEEYYVLWVIDELLSDNQPYRRYRSIASRLLVVPLKG